LGLPPGSLQKHHQTACDTHGFAVSEIIFQQGESKIDACRHPRRRPNSAVVNEDRINQHRNVGVLGAEQLAGAPMGDSASPMQQAGCSQNKRTGTDGADTSCVRRSQAKPFDKRGLCRSTMNAGPATDDKRVDIDAVAVGERSCHHLQAGRGSNRPALQRADLPDIGRTAGLGVFAGKLKCLQRPGEVEQQANPRTEQRPDGGLGNEP